MAAEELFATATASVVVLLTMCALDIGLYGPSSFRRSLVQLLENIHNSLNVAEVVVAAATTDIHHNVDITVAPMIEPPLPS